MIKKIIRYIINYGCLVWLTTFVLGIWLILDWVFDKDPSVTWEMLKDAWKCEY